MEDSLLSPLAQWSSALPQRSSKRLKPYLHQSGLLELNLGPQSDSAQMVEK